MSFVRKSLAHILKNICKLIQIIAENHQRHFLYQNLQMTVALIFGLITLFLIGLLFVPIELYIDTIANQYYLRLRGLAKAKIEGDKEELLRIRLNVLFRNFYFYPLKKIGSPKAKKIEKTKSKRTRKRTRIKKTIRVLKSFKVKRLFVNIDTGDCLLNAKLYPAFTFMNYHKGNFNINFEGRNQMVLYLRNRPIRIIKSFINI